ncbi:MAG TPA: hypothetical protein PKA03_03120, partial [Tabrizicola sp.]|nr:hypothetical protein [Tabrizicola sp.]
GDPEPDTLLRDFKSYGSRRLNRMFGDRERWWTQSGSKRKLKDDAAVSSAVNYVRDQEYPLVVWLAENSPETILPNQQPAHAGRSPGRSPETRP